MKQETNNEMDLLLRRLGRRDETTVSNAADGHLDADELSAYAENAVPPAARARYAAHLAECSRCRQLVVQLSASVGVVVATESAKVAGPSGWKKFLASFFTPMVLRYAAPALGLIVVAAIGFLIMRRDRSPNDVAQVTNTQQTPAALPTTGDGSVNYSFTNPTPSPDGFRDKQVRGVETESPARMPNAPPVVTSVETEVSKDAAAAQPKSEEQTKAANEPPPPKAAPAPEESPRAAEVEVRGKEASETPATAAAPASAKSLKLAEREDKDNSARARKPAPGAAVQGAGSVADDRRDSLGFVGETRAVAGRRFRKQNGVWTDTAYDASKDAVTVTRGSEQYRALVADEPAIKTIADTFDGPIIVVWKGRTYRIN
jgi:hypothetical protein